MAKHKVEKWMGAVSDKIEKSGHKGKLRRKLHVKAGQKIPAKKLAKAEHSSDPTERKEANLAKVFKKANHKKMERKRA